MSSLENITVELRTCITVHCLRVQALHERKEVDWTMVLC